MKLNSIINRYVFREMIPPFLINLGFLSFIFLLAQILNITNMVVNYKVSLASVFFMIVYSMPEFLRFTIPMAIMMGVLLTFLKMASDKEIIAIKAGGCSIYHLMTPVCLFCLLGIVLTSVMSVYGAAWGKNGYNKLEEELMAQSSDAVIKERVFNDQLDGVVFYVNKIDIKTKMMFNIFIEDSRNEKNTTTIVASRGKHLVSPDHPDLFMMRLFDGSIIPLNPEKLRSNPGDMSIHKIDFKVHDFAIPLEKDKNPGKKKKIDRDEMTVTELRAYINNPNITAEDRNVAVMDLHEKFSLPFACLTLGLLAMPLGLKSAFSRKTSGLGLGLVCFLVYYALMAFGWSGGKSGLFPPILGMWMPNIIMGAVGLYMLLRVAREKPIGIEFIANYYRTSRERLRAKQEPRD